MFLASYVLLKYTLFHLHNLQIKREIKCLNLHNRTNFLVANAMMISDNLTVSRSRLINVSNCNLLDLLDAKMHAPKLHKIAP